MCNVGNCSSDIASPRRHNQHCAGAFARCEACCGPTKSKQVLSKSCSACCKYTKRYSTVHSMLFDPRPSLTYWGSSTCAPSAPLTACKGRRYVFFKRSDHRKPRQTPQCRPSAASNPDGEQLASEFSQFVIQAGVSSPLSNRRPTHLLPPTGVVAAQMDALQRNDWPDQDAGVRAAFAFAKPLHAEDFTPTSVPSHVRSWHAKEDYLSWEQFWAQLHSPPYSVLLDCTSWQPASNLVFPSKRHENKAVMAVQVVASRRPAKGAAQQQQAQQQQQGTRKYTFTFCLERIDQGPYKGCWLTVGVRDGDYANA